MMLYDGCLPALVITGLVIVWCSHLYTTVLQRLLTQLKDWSHGQISEPIPSDPKDMTTKVFEWVHIVSSANPDKVEPVA